MKERRRTVCKANSSFNSKVMMIMTSYSICKKWSNKTAENGTYTCIRWCVKMKI